jgi:hypothetical protein
MSQQTTSESKSDVRAVQVLADYSQVKDLGYGFRELPIMATDAQHNVTGPSGTKMILEHDPLAEVQQEFLRLTMPQNMPFVPHPAVQETVYNLVNNATQEVKEIGFKEPIIKESHYGNSRFWVIETQLAEVVKGSHEKDDVVGLGIMVRNGYNSGIALGVDPYSMRVICSNGAIARGDDLGSATIKHVGKDPKKLLDALKVAVSGALDKAHDLISFYEALAKIKLNQKMAEHIYNSIWVGDKYFPKSFEIVPVKERKKNKPVITLTAEGRSETLWQTFNNITDPLWHALDPKPVSKTDKKGVTTTKTPAPLNIYTVGRAEQMLHNSLNFILKNKGNFGAVAAS